MADFRNFFLQLETSLASGIPIVRALRLMSGNVAGWGMKGKIERLATMIDGGTTFSEAMEKIGSPFNKMHVSFIRFGEETGCLDKVCGNLATHAEREVAVEREVIQAMIYPLFVLLVAVCLGPILEAVVAQKEWSTGLVPGLINGGILVAIMVGSYGLYSTVLRGVIDSVLMNVPFIGWIFQRFALSRFTRALSVGLAAGVTMNQALRTAIDVSDNPWLQRQLRHLPGHVGSGKGLASGLEHAGCLPGTLKEMIVVGEESGRLPEMLEKTSNHFAEEASHRLGMMMKVLPALMFLVVAMFVGLKIYTAASSILGSRGDMGELFR